LLFRSGAPVRCSGPVLRSVAPVRCSGPVLRSGAPVRCSGPVFRSGAPVRVLFTSLRLLRRIHSGFYSPLSASLRDRKLA
ncbi:Hypothetical predicted protein, partial [Scomber scombrus]